VRRSDGKVMQKLAVGSAPEDIRLVGSDVVEVVLYSGKRPRFRLRGWDGPQPRIDP
jgi:hypothetical protein